MRKRQISCSTSALTAQGFSSAFNMIGVNADSGKFVPANCLPSGKLTRAPTVAARRVTPDEREVSGQPRLTIPGRNPWPQTRQ